MPPILPPPVAGAGGEPGEITAMRQASGAPFPPPAGSFPAPPGLTHNIAAAEKAAKAGKKAGAATPGSRKKLIMIVGGAVAAVALLGGGFFAYRKLTAEPPPPPPRPKVVPKPKPPAPVVEKAPEPVVVEAPKPGPVAEKPVEVAAPVVPPPPPPPPPASHAFKAWVENLKVSGVRAGAVPKVFIGGTAYAPGDLVNPQLGISFAGYDSATRMIIFKDASGAKVERRN